MPRSIDYKRGAIIYFEGDRAEKLYVLQSGEVEIISTDISTNAKVHDYIGPGEFFGVKSAMGNFPREDAAAAAKDSRVMVFTIPEFESFCMGNTRIVLKMLKVFSNQLRQVNKQLSRVLKVDEANADDGLCNLGERFLAQNRYEKAHYVFKRYVTEYPEGANIEKVKKNLALLEKIGVKGKGVS